jgi:hypothetical protein
MKLSQAHPKLQRLLTSAIKVIDFSVIETHRKLERQKELVASGQAKTLNSKHLSYPSEAVDIQPYPYTNDDKSLNQFYFLVGVIKGISVAMDIKIRLGADWNSNLDIRDDIWQDVFHVELIDG